MKVRGLAIALVLAVSAGIAADELAPAAPATPAPTAPFRDAGGSLVCPFALVAGASGTIHLANVGSDPALVRVTIQPDTGKAKEVSLTLRSDGVTSVSVHRHVSGPAGALIEYAGGRLVASHSLAYARRGIAGGWASETCAPPGPSTAVVTSGSTLNAGTSIALFNPGGGDALVDVILVAGERRFAPERLRGIVVPARRRRVVRAEDFAFNHSDVAAIVRMTTGRVVAEGLLTTRAGGASLMAMHEPAQHLVAAAAPGRATASFGLLAVGGDGSTISGRAIGPGEQGAIAGLPTDLEPRVSVRASVAGRDPIAYSISSEAGSPLSAGMRWRTGARAPSDLSVAHAASGARRWAGVLAPAGGRPGVAKALLVNAGGEPVSVRVRALGKGAPAARTIVIDAGRVASYEFGRGTGTMAVEAVADAPIAVTLYAVVASRGYAAALTPASLPVVPAVSVNTDPRVAVPARLRSEP